MDGAFPARYEARYSNNKKLVEDSDWRLRQICIHHGYSPAEADALDPVERLAVYYYTALQDGYKVDWNTGRVSDPPSAG